MKEPTQARVKELLDYNPETGVFTWKVNRTRGVKAGDAAGTINRSHGYIIVCIDNRRYRGHRLAWFVVHGSWPAFDLDHVDTDRTNNCIKNLRPTDDTMNTGNSSRYKNNTSGYKGVSWHKSKKAWFANIRVNGRLVCLGKFSDPQAAHNAYMTAARAHFGEFARAG